MGVNVQWGEESEQKIKVVYAQRVGDDEKALDHIDSQEVYQENTNPGSPPLRHQRCGFI